MLPTFHRPTSTRYPTCGRPIDILLTSCVCLYIYMELGGHANAQCLVSTSRLSITLELSALHHGSVGRSLAWVPSQVVDQGWVGNSGQVRPDRPPAGWLAAAEKLTCVRRSRLCHCVSSKACSVVTRLSPAGWLDSPARAPPPPPGACPRRFRERTHHPVLLPPAPNTATARRRVRPADGHAEAMPGKNGRRPHGGVTAASTSPRSPSRPGGHLGHGGQAHRDGACAPHAGRASPPRARSRHRLAVPTPKKSKAARAAQPSCDRDPPTHMPSSILHPPP
jgi:hypothetical protein